jgi:DNA topoisomerase-1
VVLRSGRFGPYVSSGDRKASLFRSQSPDTITFQDALRLLSLPRTVGVDESGAEIIAANGRYGPYVKRGDDFRSLDSEDKLFTVTLDEAIALLAAPKTRQRRAAAPPLRELGPDPVTERPMVIKDGRFGPYVTDGEVNASLRRGQTPEELSVEQASEMLAEKRAKGPAPGRKAAKKAATADAPAKATAQKTTAKKATAKKATAKKATPKKAAAKKASPARKATNVSRSTAKKAPAKAPALSD